MDTTGYRTPDQARRLLGIDGMTREELVKLRGEVKQRRAEGLAHSPRESRLGDQIKRPHVGERPFVGEIPRERLVRKLEFVDAFRALAERLRCFLHRGY